MKDRPVTRGDGDQVYLSWKQLAGIIGTVGGTGMAASGIPATFLYDQNSRITVVETRQKMNEVLIENNRLSIEKIGGHSASLLRIEQHLEDIDRRLSHLEDDSKKP